MKSAPATGAKRRPYFLRDPGWRMMSWLACEVVLDDGAPQLRFVPQALPEVLLIEPVVHRDARGMFVETYREDAYRSQAGIPRFVQHNVSASCEGTLRGLHAQLRRPQAKLVRVLEGTIYDVALDIRRDSATFGAWVGLRLEAEDHTQLYLPPGFAHGFCVLSARAVVSYMTSDYYDPGGELVVAWDDPALGIAWPCRDPLLSARDRSAPRLAEVRDSLPTVAEAARLLDSAG